MPGPMILPDGPEITRRVLQREQIGTYRAISRYVLENAEYQVIEDELHGMMVRLVSEVLTERAVSESHTVSLKTPRTWWQHFKYTYCCTFWLRWFVRRRPIEYDYLTKIVSFDSKRLFPNADIPKQVTPLGRPIMYETISETDWSSS